MSPPSLLKLALDALPVHLIKVLPNHLADILLEKFRLQHQQRVREIDIFFHTHFIPHFHMVGKNVTKVTRRNKLMSFVLWEWHAEDD